jgi:uncharacterized transporter YbjL
MRRDKYLSLFLFVIFSSAGVYLLHDSLHDPSRYADAGVLAGALLSALALASIAWATRQHLMTKALQRHLRRRHGRPRNLGRNKEGLSP